MLLGPVITSLCGGKLQRLFIPVPDGDDKYDMTLIVGMYSKYPTIRKKFQTLEKFFVGQLRALYYEMLKDHSLVKTEDS